LLTALSTATIFAYWGLNFGCRRTSLAAVGGGCRLQPAVATSGRTDSVRRVLGYVSFGWVADAFGRRRSFLVYLLTAAVWFGIWPDAPVVLAFLVR
jgi:hypothetical protein